MNSHATRLGRCERRPLPTTHKHHRRLVSPQDKLNRLHAQPFRPVPIEALPWRLPLPDSAKGSTFAFVSLGCPKNLVDSERMLGKLAQAGYQLTADPRDGEGADVVVVNTCGFIEPARQESLGVIREMLELKRQGK